MHTMPHACPSGISSSRRRRAPRKPQAHVAEDLQGSNLVPGRFCSMNSNSSLQKWLTFITALWTDWPVSHICQPTCPAKHQLHTSFSHCLPHSSSLFLSPRSALLFEEGRKPRGADECGCAQRDPQHRAYALRQAWISRVSGHGELYMPAGREESQGEIVQRGWQRGLLDAPKLHLSNLDCRGRRETRQPEGSVPGPKHGFATGSRAVHVPDAQEEEESGQVSRCSQPCEPLPAPQRQEGGCPSRESDGCDGSTKQHTTCKRGLYRELAQGVLQKWIC